jgi:hypothetical protein
VKRFYVLWFFISAGWGYLLADMSNEEPKYSMLQTLGVLPLSALSFFALLAIAVWRLGPNKKLSPPSISLKPWHMPVGGAQFVFITFLFSSAWAVVFVLVRQSGFLQQPLQFLFMSVGGLIGVWGVHHVFRAKFVA